MSAFTIGRAPRSSTEAELAAFEDICERLAGFEPALSPEWVDGWLAALASGPLRLPFEEWIALLADDAFERAFGDPVDQARARDALQTRLDALLDQLDADALLDDPDALRLEPLMGEWTEDDRLALQRDKGLTAEDAALMQTGALWSEGFCAGCADLLARWSSPALDAAATADLEAHLDAVKALQQPDDADEAEGATGPAGEQADVREQMIDAACLAVQDLRLWWLDHAPTPPPRRVAPEPGRNDPCPCGSGRKYKKCHGST